MKLDLKQLTLEETPQFTVLGGQVHYRIKAKGKVLFESTDKDQVENWLRDNCIVNKVLGINKKLEEAITRAYATSNSRRT